MQRFLTLTLATVAAVGALDAGTIQTQIGGVNGLTTTYVTSGVGSTGGWTEKNYDGQLFQNATPSPVPYTGYSTTAANTGTITDSTDGVTFAMINDGVNINNRSNNFWQANSAGSIVVPVGIQNVTDVWTMLNNVWGTPNAVDTTVEFDFGTTATNANLAPLIISLTNAGNNGATGGQIGAGVNSTTTCAASSCNYAIDPLAASSSIGGITVKTDNVFSAAYSSIGGSGMFAGSAGELTLDAQGFIFGSLYQSGQYLVDVKITESSGAVNTSATSLSAITVDSTTGASNTNADTAAPEPSSIWLMIVGLLGVSGYGIRRRLA